VPVRVPGPPYHKRSAGSAPAVCRRPAKGQTLHPAYDGRARF
jgi:hypothetical protein